MLSKSDYLRFLQCPRYLWLFKNRKGKVAQTERSLSDKRTIEEGNEVESYARKLFPTGKLAEGFYEEAHKSTKALLDSDEKVIFQATAIVDGLLAMADIFEYDEVNKYWIINEVKSSTEVDDDHITDTCFQKIAFEKAGFNIGKINLVHINNEYVRSGEIKPKKLFKIEDITEQVKEIEPETKDNIEIALKVTKQDNEPMPKIIKQCNRRKTKQCPFIPYCWKDVPEYSIYDLNRISKKKIIQLLDSNALKITDIPLEGFPLTEIQENQLTAAITDKVMIDEEAIKGELSGVEYPLYFLDYETFFPAIPLFDGYKPYQQMTFQYSLHVVEAEGEKAKHFEFLQKEYADPVPDLLVSLKSNIGGTGSVIVWNKTFEMLRNTEMGEMHPEYAPFMESVNSRVYDLMDIFTKQYYVHPAFKGSASIKKVLPVLVPELSHSDLEISEGATASIKWFEMVSGAKDEHLYKNLLAYCEMDTLAMVRLYEALKRV
jgi:hypothetical protein